MEDAACRVNKRGLKSGMHALECSSSSLPRLLKGICRLCAECDLECEFHESGRPGETGSDFGLELHDIGLAEAEAGRVLLDGSGL